MSMNEEYLFIKSKISSMKEAFPQLRNKADDYVFSALSIKSNLYKNPALNFDVSKIQQTIVDGSNDGGVDAILIDPNSEESNLVLVQSKFYQSISFEDISSAVAKMWTFYKNMIEGNYEGVNQNVQRTFLTLNAEVGDESKIVFVVYTSALKSGIRNDRLQKAFAALTNGLSAFELKVYFGDDLVEEIKEAESRRPTVETGKLFIDEADNVLYYNDDAAIVNVSAFCIKELYGAHGVNLLARNLRYHVGGTDVDRGIKETIRDNPNHFWFKNNGLTIICDTFTISGKEVKLTNFSIVNGGQTTYNLHKSKDLNRDNDFFLPCKIINVIGETEDQKNLFSLEIAKATNSQKAIKKVDLKANSPEQVRFSASMREQGIFYQTKRGEIVPKDFKDEYKNTDLSEVGKLALAAIFQLPATSRSKPSALYNQEYYEPVFNGDQSRIARLSKELLYIDYYFRNHFLGKFDEKYQNDPNAIELIPFAHNARTSCIAFVSLACRLKQGNITNEHIKTIFSNVKEGAYSTVYYDIFRNINGLDCLLPRELFMNKDNYDKVLFKLFEGFIKAGRRCYSADRRHDSSLNETNYLKKDLNYYTILKQEWDSLVELISSTFEMVDELLK